MLASPRTATAVLGCLVVSLLTCAPAAPAATPATVTVRVEGVSETKLPSTLLTTNTEPVVKDGKAEDACPGTSALGALQLATSGNWSGPWNAQFNQYEIFSIEGESHVFEPGAPANYFWSFWLDDKESEVGACEAQLNAGDRVLFFPSCFGAACPPAPAPLEIEAPPSAAVGQAVAVSVRRFQASGASSPAAGATITGGSVPAVTNAAGAATLTFTGAGQLMLRVSAPESVRTEAAICVHNGNDGSCGAPAPSQPSTPSPTAGVSPSRTTGAPQAPYKGPFAVVAQIAGISEHHVFAHGHAPRLLTGTVSAHTPVTSVSIALRRAYRGRCLAYSGVRERFAHAPCGSARFFEVARTSRFSYLLPAALLPGRYVLDVEAADAAGNRTVLARGTSRIVFFVR
jgi:hypothetical protein